MSQFLLGGGFMLLGLAVVLILVFCPFGVSASEEVEVVEETHEEEEKGKYRFRLSLHGQKFFSGEEGLGIAGWGIVPDLVTVRESPSGFFLAGLIYKKDHSDVEVLGGVLTNSHRGEPVLDLRATHEVGRWEGCLIATYLVDSKEIELEPEVTYETPWHFRFGGEVEIRRSGDWTWSVGPKLIIPIPFLSGSSLRATYQFGPEEDFLRTELWFSF